MVFVPKIWAYSLDLGGRATGQCGQRVLIKIRKIKLKIRKLINNEPYIYYARISKKKKIRKRPSNSADFAKNLKVWSHCYRIAEGERLPRVLVYIYYVLGEKPGIPV